MKADAPATVLQDTDALAAQGTSHAVDVLPERCGRPLDEAEPVHLPLEPLERADHHFGALEVAEKHILVFEAIAVAALPGSVRGRLDEQAEVVCCVRRKPKRLRVVVSSVKRMTRPAGFVSWPESRAAVVVSERYLRTPGAAR